MKKMTFKEFVNNEKSIKLEVIDLIPEPSFSNAYMQYSDYLTEQIDTNIDYLSYVEESYTETINYTNYVAEHLYVDKGYVDDLIYEEYTRYDSRKKVYDKRKKIIKKLLGE